MPRHCTLSRLQRTRGYANEQYSQKVSEERKDDKPGDLHLRKPKKADPELVGQGRCDDEPAEQKCDPSECAAVQQRAQSVPAALRR